MRWYIEKLSFTGAILLGIVLLSAQSPIANFPPGVFSNRAAIDGVGGYQGPFDATGVANYAWVSGSRAYSAAYAAGGNKAIKVVDTATGALSCDVVFLATGFPDLSTTYCTGNTLSVTTFCTVTHPAGCSVTTAYDQTGNGHDFIEATLANMPLYAFSALNGNPAINCGNGSSNIFVLVTATNNNLAQPLSYSAVWKRTGAGTNSGAAFASSGGNTGIGNPTAGNLGVIFAGTAVTFAVTDGNWHGLQAVLNGATSAYNIDGSDTTGVNAGTTATGASASFGLCRGGVGTGTGQLGGLVAEGGTYPSATAISATVRGQLYTNQHLAYGSVF